MGGSLGGEKLGMVRLITAASDLAVDVQIERHICIVESGMAKLRDSSRQTGELCVGRRLLPLLA